ncbi:MAG: glycosyltransferase [Candidatus Paceibacterota bacterium]|jgi:glycosyltransferase involved in cell wall biosynthesis
MKILIVTTKGELGGAQIFAKNLAIGLKNKGHFITLAIGNDKGDFLENSAAEEKIDFKRFYNLSRSFSPLKNLFFVLESRKYIIESQFDVIQINSSNALFIALGARFVKNRPQIIFTHHGLSFLDPNSKKHLSKFFLWLMFKLLLPLVDKNIFVSKTNLEYALKTKLIKRGQIIHNGLDANFLPKKESVEIFEKIIGEKLTNKLIIGSIGRLAYPKNYELLMETAPVLIKENPDTAFILIGDGPEKPRYQNFISKLNIESNFFMLGGIKNASELLGGFDIFILPSIYEGLSLTMIEATKAGLPVLASDTGGNSEILNDDKRQLFSLENKKEVFEKINFLIKNEPVRSEYGKKNQENSQKFSLDKMVEEYNNLL